MSRTWKTVVAISLALNVLVLMAGALAISHLGARGAAEATGLIEPRRPAYEFYAEERWSSLPSWDGTVLIGDSHIERGPWAELLDEPVAVRGQSGALTAEVSGWVDTVPAEARRVVVWAGTNDALQRRDGEQVGADMSALLGTLQAQAPHAALVVLTVPPLPGVDSVDAANDAIRQAAEQAGARVVDTTTLSGSGMIGHDGVHLTAEGYEAVARLLASR